MNLKNTVETTDCQTVASLRTRLGPVHQKLDYFLAFNSPVNGFGGYFLGKISVSVVSV